MNRKGDISIQFNWIFVLIAGAVLFGFFISVTVWQGNNAKNDRYSKTITQVESVLLNLEESVTNSEESFRTFTVPGTKFEHRCGEINEFRIKDSDFSIPSNRLFLFSKEELTAGRFNSWVVNWDLPYKVAPFILLDDEKTAYVFIETPGNTGELRQLIEDFPKDLPIFIETTNTFEDKGYKHHKLIFLNGATNQQYANLNSFSAVNIKPESTSRYTGTGVIEFLSQGPNNIPQLEETYPFLKRESVFGAIFSEDAAHYKCSMEKAVNQLQWISQFHLNKSNELLLHANSSISCHSSYYINPSDFVSSLMATSFDAASFASAESTSTNLDLVNEDLLKKSCPVIY